MSRKKCRACKGEPIKMTLHANDCSSGGGRISTDRHQQATGSATVLQRATSAVDLGRGRLSPRRLLGAFRAVIIQLRYPERCV